MIVKTILPEQLSVRPASLADIAIIYELDQAYDLANYSRENETLEEARAAWTEPGTDLQKDSWLVFDASGRLLGYGLIQHTMYVQYSFSACIQPDYSDARLGEYLLEQAEGWAREHIERAEPGVRVILKSWLPGNDQTGRQLYERWGLREIRRFWHMEIDLAESPPVPVWPAGIELRPYRPELDERLAFRIIDTAFRDHWGHIPNRFAKWKHWTIERPGFDPSLWFIAYKDGQAVGGVFCEAQDAGGWVDDLAVLREARGEGLGTALLLHSFNEFYRRGKRVVGLGVDSQNLTGALRLYQRAGMHRVQENINYEKELRAGVEPSTRELMD
ncbi:MAG TPA: GNAT family N-acetyltransferase [Ktedonobacteraceae bacterium]